MGSLVCRVELHKKNGIIITVENNDDEITQTMVLDGRTITTTCEGDDETSVIIQAPDSITIQCKDFLLDADTITCQSSSDTVHRSDGNFEATSSAAMELSAGAALKASAGTSMKLSANAIETAASPGDITISGTNVTTEAKIKAGVGSKTLELKGNVSAKMEGGLVDVKGTKTTVEGSVLTTIGGALIKIG